jgi:hypothetical protein
MKGPVGVRLVSCHITLSPCVLDIVCLEADAADTNSPPRYLYRLPTQAPAEPESNASRRAGGARLLLGGRGLEDTGSRRCSVASHRARAQT